LRGFDGDIGVPGRFIIIDIDYSALDNPGGLCRNAGGEDEDNNCDTFDTNLTSNIE